MSLFPSRCIDLKVWGGWPQDHDSWPQASTSLTRFLCIFVHTEKNASAEMSKKYENYSTAHNVSNRCHYSHPDVLTWKFEGAVDPQSWPQPSSSFQSTITIQGFNRRLWLKLRKSKIFNFYEIGQVTLPLQGSMGNINFWPLGLHSWDAVWICYV